MRKGDQIIVNKTVSRVQGDNTKIIAESGQTGEYLAPFSDGWNHVYINDNVLMLMDGEFDVPDYSEMFHPPLEDIVVARVIAQFAERSYDGIKKYGTTLAANNTDNFLQHLKEELMDAVCYIEKLQHDENNRKKKSTQEKVKDGNEQASRH